MSRRVKSLTLAFSLVVSTVVTTAIAIVASPVASASASTPSESFSPVYTYSNNDGVSQIYNFGEHTCGVQDDVMWCWGSNGNHRIGRYRWLDGQSARPVPRLARGGYGDGNFQLCPRPSDGGECTSTTTTFDNSGTKGIVGMGGLYTTCMIQGASPSAVTGQLYCMGYNATGQAGLPTAGNQNFGIVIPAPVSTNGGFTNSNIISVDGGVDFSCALQGSTATSTDGALYCWGDDFNGQLANGPTGGGGGLNHLPVAAATGGGFNNTAVSSLSVGFHHGCVVETSKVFCWGNNGDAVAKAGTQIWPPQLVSGGSGTGYALLITTGGGGRAGQPASTASLNAPTAVQSGDGFTNTAVTEVSAGYRHTCAIESGVVYCWGNNQSGQLGDGSTTASDSPRKVLSGDGFTNTAVTQVVAGDHFTCAIEGGVVYCWGDQQLGRLGNFTSVLRGSVASPFYPQFTPVKVADGAIVGGNTGVNRLASGAAAHSCAIKGDKAYCWGAGRRWATLSDGSVGGIVYAGPGPDYSTDAPQPRLVQWGPANEPSPYDPVYPAGVPTDVVATSGWNSVTVNWKAPVYTGTYPITYYLVTAYPSGRSCLSKFTDANFTQCTYTSLTPGTKYTFGVQALNGAGWGEESSPSGSASPMNLKIIGYARKALPIILGQKSDLVVNGIAPGYAPSTKVIPWVKIGEGAWVAQPSSNLKVSSGKFTWVRRFAKNLNGVPIRVKFEVAGNFSNTVIIPTVRTNRSLFAAESVGSDLGGMPDTEASRTDIQFGFDSGADITAGLPVLFDGRNLKPGTTVTATIQRTIPAGSAQTLWGPSPARSLAPIVQTISGTVGTAISASTAFTPAGFTPTTYSATLPAGLTIDATTGVVSGTPTAASTTQVTVTGSDGTNSATARIGFNIAASSSTSLSPATQVVSGVVGVPLETSTLSPTGLVGAVTYAATGLPAGLFLDADTGVIQGSPLVESTAHVVITASGATSGSAKATVSLNIVTTTASATVNENGDAYALINLPVNLSPGVFTIVFSGTKPDGTAVSESNEFELTEGQPLSMFSAQGGPSSEGNYVLYASDVTPKPLGPTVRSITAVTPARLADTRDTSVVSAGGVLEVQVTGRGGVPAGANTAILNVTATDHVGDGGYLTAYACESTRRETSNLNVDNGGTVANAVTVELGASGKVCIYSYKQTHIVVDVTGYGAQSSTMSYSPVTSRRILDTRQVDSATKRLAAGQLVELSMPSSIPSSAEAVALNLTLVDTAAWGWAAVYPCGQERPNTSTVNALAGQTVAGSALALLGAGDKVCVYTSVETDLIVDVFGWYGESAPAQLQSHDAIRVLDTRKKVVLSTFVEEGVTIEEADDEVYVYNTPIVAGSVSAVSTDLDYLGDASAVVANLTVTSTEGDGYLTVFDCRTEMPIVSNLNFKTGETRANQIVIPTTSDSICVYNSATAHIVVDLVGRFIEGLQVV